jgi:hypothetical protein
MMDRPEVKLMVSALHYPLRDDGARITELSSLSLTVDPSRACC